MAARPAKPSAVHRVLCELPIAEICAAGCVSILERAADDELEGEEQVLELSRHFLYEYSCSLLGDELRITDVEEAAGRYCADMGDELEEEEELEEDEE